MNNNSRISRKTGSAVFCLAVLFSFSMLSAQEMAPYCCAPPFVTTVVPPNILISFDNSGSMFDRAYSTTTLYMTDTTKWYGYYKCDSMYRWASNHWESDPAGIWPGNILNWVCMSRSDIAKKVLTGGKGNLVAGKARLLSNGRLNWTKRYYRDASNYNTFSITHSANLTYVSVTRTGTNPPINAILPSTYIAVDIPEVEYRGVLDQIGDKDNDRHWDDDAPIFGLWHYNYDRGGHIRDYLGDPDIIDLRNHINDVVCDTWTPLAENMFEITHYFSQAPYHYFNADYTPTPGGLKDPYYDKYSHSMVPCRRSFVLMLTDGESTMDTEIPANDPNLPNCNNLQNYYDGINPLLPDDGTDYLDDVCLYSHVNDLRPDSGSGWGNRELADDQSLTTFIIYAFGTIGSNLLKESAMCGGFKDKNGNKLPDLQEEWDEDGDSIPDNYYEARNGWELEAAIKKAIMAMLERISSSSAVSVVSMGTKAGGATAAAQFYPRRTFPTGEVLTWIGTCQSLWIDPYGWMREDNANPATLHLIDDNVITMEFDPGAGGSGNVVVTRLHDSTGRGDPNDFDTIGTVMIEDMIPIWDAGRWLWNHSPAQRNIKTFVDANKDHVVDPGEIWDFTAGNAPQLKPHLNVATDSVAQLLIDYVRGTDVNGWRERTADGRVWKLADIINSSAIVIQRPVERYDFIYGDNTYGEYYDQYINRRQVVFVGGNDGMLHCLNGGQPMELLNDLTPMMYLPNGFDLGQEIWSFIPYNLLPHLKWLAEPTYCHVYYVDMKVYITDAKIFANDAIHPNGWGTVLVGAMRLGGMPIESAVDTCYSSYFLLDITDPVNMVPMWEFKHPDMRMSACYSTVVKVDSSWYLAFGSGPMTCSGESSQQASIYILDLASGTLLRQITLPDASSFITNIFGVDWGMDYTVDRLYFGTCYEDASLPGDWGGKIYLIETNDEEDPALWDTTMVFNMRRPVTAEGSIATDDYNHLWLYYGSGRFFSDVDEADTATTQYYIGVREDTTHSQTIAGLYNVTNVWIDTAEIVHGAPGCTNFSDLIDTVNAYAGWYREMPGSGERTITTSLVFGGAVLFTTFMPTGDICSYGGQGNLWALFYRTGTAYTQPFLLADSTEERHPEWIGLGPGMPSEPSLYVSSDQTKVFIQAGGGIVSPETGIPGLPASGVLIWKGR